MYLTKKEDLVNLIENKEFREFRVPKQSRWLIARSVYELLMDKLGYKKDKSKEPITVALPGEAWIHRGLANPSQWILNGFADSMKDQRWWEDFVYAIMKIATQELPTIQMYLSYNEPQAEELAEQFVNVAYHYAIKQTEISQSAIEQLILQCDDPVVIINNGWRKAREWVYHMSKDTKWLITRYAEDDWRLATVADPSEQEYRYGSNRELLPKKWLDKSMTDLNKEYDVEGFVFVNKDLNQALFTNVEAATEVANSLLK